MEKRFPFFGCGEEDCDKDCPDGADDAVEEGREGETVVGALELLDRLVEVDDAVEEGEDFGGEGGYVAHCPVVGVEEGEEDAHPAGEDEVTASAGEVCDLVGGVLVSEWREFGEGETYVE